MPRELIALLVTLFLCLTACTTQPSAPSHATPDLSAAPLNIVAAGSLAEVIIPLGASFERETGTMSTFSFGDSAELVAQVQGGAPADVLVAADEATMTKARESGVVTAEPTVFATDTQTIAFAPVAASTRTIEAEQFIAYLTSLAGQEVLGDAGFVSR